MALAQVVVLEGPGGCPGLGVAVARALVVWVAERPLVTVVAAGLGLEVVGMGLVALLCLLAVVPVMVVALAL